MKYLVILVHGLHGNHNDFDLMAKQLMSDGSIDCLLSQSNFRKTHDGIPTMANRLLNEVLDHLEDYLQDAPSTQRIDLRFSVVGHSLGGLIAWYFANLLLDNGSLLAIDSKFMDLSERRDIILKRFNLYPCGFYTVSSPILGARRSSSGLKDSLLKPILDSLVPYAVNSLAWRVLGPTGRQLFLMDEDLLLLEMTDPTKRYVKSLKLFKTRTMIGHVQDLTVPFESAVCLPDYDIIQSSPEIQNENQFCIVYQDGFHHKHALYSKKFHDTLKNPVDDSIEHRTTVLTEVFRSLDSAKYISPMESSSNPSNESVLSMKLDDVNKRTILHEIRVARSKSTPIFTHNISKLFNDHDDIWMRGRTIEYHMKHKHCNTADIFRRVIMDYGVRDPIQTTLVHAVLVGKKLWWQSSTISKCSQESSNWLAQCILEDFKNCELGLPADN